MICDACGAQIPDGAAECGTCGCPVIVGLDDSPEAREQRRVFVEKYREYLDNSIEVGFYAYSHTIKEQEDGSEKLVLSKTEKIVLANCGKLKIGETVWWPEGFLRPKSKKITFDVFYRGKNRPEVKRSLEFPMRPDFGDIYIGVKKFGIGKIQICLTDYKDYDEESVVMNVGQ